MVLKATDSPCRDVILKALTRLNDKSTLRAAADELAIIVRALDAESLSALVLSICSTTGWDPKPVAKKECVRVLALLPLPSCPVADAALQHHLPKILTYLRKTLQDTDGVVREASGEALAAFAQGCSRLSGCAVPGSTAAPVVKVVFDCLAEQKKEAQMGASQALLKMSPCLAPLDKELVKVILKLLRSPSFLGTAQLLAAVASTDADTRTPGGLLKHGAAAFVPFINHLVGQPAPQQQRRTSVGQDGYPTAARPHSSSSSGGGSAASSSSASGKPVAASGILGCLSSKDWAVRRAAADAVRAAVLLLGPELEPEQCWGLGDPGSVTGRCLNALEECRFDKVKEAREAAREAAALISQLHRFVAEEGPDGAWRAWASNNLPYYSGWQSPAPSSPRSPLSASKSPAGAGGRSFKQQLAMSPIAERFRRAAVNSDVIVEPGSRALQVQHSTNSSAGTAEEEEEGQAAVAVAAVEQQAAAAPAASGQLASGSGAAEEEEAQLVAEVSLQPESSQHSVASASLTAEHSSSSVREGGAVSKQHSQTGSLDAEPSAAAAAAAPLRPRKLVLTNSGAAAGRSVQSTPSGSRPGSAPGSRPGSAGRQRGGSNSSSTSTSAGSSRRTSAQDQAAPLLKQSSSSSAVAGGPVPSYAAGTKSSAAKGGLTAAAGRCPLPGGGSSSRRASATTTQKSQAAGQGPTQLEWQQLQQHLQEQAAANQLRHAAELQQQQASSAASFAALQERVTALEAQVQQQQLVIQQQQQCQATPAAAPGSLQGSKRSPSRSSGSPASAAGLTAAAVAAISTSPVGGVLSKEVQQVMFAAAQQHQHQPPPGALTEECGPPSSASSSRLYKSAEWLTPHASGGGARKASLISAVDPLSANAMHRSFNSLLLTTPASGLKLQMSCESAMATPGDLESAYADALQRNERGGVHLLRLCGKTGPVWPQLSEATCQGLMEVFIKHVRDGVMLHRVLPWLWRLADDDSAGRPEVGPPLRQQLLEALETCPAAEDLQAQEKVCLLLDTLKAVWMADAGVGAGDS